MRMTTLTIPEGTVDVGTVGSGPMTIIALHASATGPRALLPFAELLAAQDCTVVLPALQGYETTRVNIADPLHANLRIVSTLIAKTTAPTALFGHSMGGLVAALSAGESTNLVGAALFEPIVLEVLDPGSNDEQALRAWDANVVRELSEAVLAGEPERGVALFVEAWNEVRWTRIPESTRTALVRAAPQLVAETAATGRAGLPGSGLASLPVPLALYGGTASPALATAMLHRLAAFAQVPAPKLLDGLGHMGPIVASRTVAESMACWIGALHSAISI
jgi:pimeloyl-ACP methyl ester carboxylesterase